MLSGLAEEAKRAMTTPAVSRSFRRAAAGWAAAAKVLEEIRNADKAGIGMEQTDRRLMRPSERHRNPTNQTPLSPGGSVRCPALFINPFFYSFSAIYSSNE